MRKLKLLLTATALLIGGGISAWAQTNLVAGWDGGNNTSSPSNFGWTSSANRTLQPRNNDGGIRMTTTYSNYKNENGNNYTYSSTSDPSSVIFWVRYNSSGESFTYTFQGLEPNHYYAFSGLVGWHNNSSSPTFTVKINDGTSDLATMSKAISDKQKLYSVSTHFTTPSTITNTTDFKIIFTCNRANNEDCMEAISGLKLVDDYAAYEADLSKYLAYAKKLNAKLSNSDLTTAISTAQEIADDGKDNATFDNVEALKNAISAAISTYPLNPEGDDVSTLFLLNNGFDIDINFASSSTTATSGNTNYPTFGWTSSVPGNCTGATFGYGYTGSINGGNAAAPTQNADNNTDGGGLIICVGWSGVVTYQSSVQSFPAGSYRITYRTYNGNNKNTSAVEAIPLVGFIPTSGDSQLNNAIESFANQTWSTHTFDFELAAATEGKIQIGLKPTSNTNSYNAPELFIDDITLIYYNPTALAKIQWKEVRDALDALDETVLPYAAEKAITNTLTAQEPTTAEGYNTAKETMQALIDSYDDIKAAYDKALNLITLATNEKTNSTGTKTTIETAISTATTDIETRTSAADLISDYNALEASRQAYILGGAQPTDGHPFDFTFKILDAKVISKDNWTNGNTNSGEQYTGAPDNTYLDIYNTNTSDMKQVIGALPIGRYLLKVATRAIASLTVGNIYVYQNEGNLGSADINHDGNNGGELGNGWSWTEVNFTNLDNEKDITVGFYSECGNSKWAGADDFTLFYLGNFVTDEAATEILASIVEGKMNADVATAQTNAKNTFDADRSVTNYANLQAAITNATNSVAAYTKAGETLTQMQTLTTQTNVYTTSALNNYYTQWKTKYDNNTLTDEEANALQNPFTKTGWHASITADNFLMSSWNSEPDFKDGESPYYINTWSEEGNTDGTGMTTPFFEYYVDEGKLAERTLTATMEGVTPGNYYVDVLVRISKNAGEETTVHGITLDVNDGIATDLCTGEKDVNSRFYGTFRALGTVGDDGVLKININVAEDNNVHWLAFKNVVYTEFDGGTVEQKTALANAIEEAEGKTLGFENIQYAPYNNIEALEALVAAKAINPETATATEITTATNELTGATWTANATDVDAIYNGNMAVTNGWNPKGWTRVGNGWGQQITELDTETQTTNGTAWYYNANSSSQYGNDGVYTMPLAANTYYDLTLSYRSQTNGLSSLKVSVLNGEEGLALTELGANTTTTFSRKSVRFQTGAAGNYILSIANTGNFYFTDVTLTKTTLTDMADALNATKEEAKAALDSNDYENVKGSERVQLTASCEKVPETETISVYGALIDEINEKKATFIAAKTNYDAVATAIAEAQAIVNGAVNVGSNAFQIPISAQTTLSDAIDNANSGVENEKMTAAETSTLIETLNAAVTTYNSAELNVPEETQAYNLVFNCEGHSATGNALTLIPNPSQTQGLYGLQYKATANVNLAQAFYFVHTTGNKYKVVSAQLQMLLRQWKLRFVRMVKVCTCCGIQVPTRLWLTMETTILTCLQITQQTSSSLRPRNHLSLSTQRLQV